MAETDVVRLTDREMQLFNLALKHCEEYMHLSGMSWGTEDTVRGLASRLGFETHEEDIKILCGPFAFDTKTRRYGNEDTK